jgi:hypothetical protein
MFWGAGATAELGALTTVQIAEALSRLAGWVEDDQSPATASSDSGIRCPPGFNYRCDIEARCERIPAFKGADQSRKRKLLRDILNLLGDGNGCRTKRDAEQARRDSVDEVVREKLDPTYLRQFGCTGDLSEEDREAFRAELHAWPHRYDWLGLKALMPAMSRSLWLKDSKRGPVNLQDLLTAIEQLAQLEAGLHGAHLFDHDPGHPQMPNATPEQDPIEPYRIPAIRECVALLIGILQRLALQDDDGKLKREVTRYREFSEALVTLNLQEARALASQGHKPERRAFYLGSLGVISTNWDPLLQAFWFAANNRHNHGNSEFVPGSCRTLKLYHDQGPEVGLRHLNCWNTGQGRKDVFFAFGEAAAQRLNREGAGNHLYRFNKLLQLHGGFHWRDCPRCGRIFTTAPNYEDETDGVMLGPSVLPEICCGWSPGESVEEQREWRRGRFGSVQCIYCGYMTQPHDTPLLTQTVIKPARHYLHWALFREMGLLVAKAKHLVLVGYSLPRDDLINRCFMQSSASGRAEQPFVTVVVKDTTDRDRRVARDGWVRPANVWEYLQLNGAKGEVDEAAQSTVKSIVEVFGPGRRANGSDGFRVSLHGFPGVLDELGQGSIELGTLRLLYPDDHGICFPMKRSPDG